MAKLRVLKQSFVSGILSPVMDGRVDIAKYQSGLSQCNNFIVRPQGPVVKRGGMRFVNETKASPFKSRLIPFSFNNEQTFAIELGAGYFRFHTQGGTLQSGGVPYEVANSYSQADIADIHYVQSGDIITFVHPNYPPMELRRLSNLNWTFVQVQFASTLAPPTNVTVTKTVASTGVPRNFTYKVTALDEFGKEESVESVVSNTISNDLTISGNYNTITWTLNTNAKFYNVYKSTNGAYGFIGQVASNTMIDDNILADMTITPPLVDTDFASGAGKYPAAVGYYEQRRVFAGTDEKPQSVWASQAGTESNMNYSVPSKATDALRFRIAAQKANHIRHVVTLLDMILLTASTEFRIYAGNASSLEASTLTIKQQTQNGASNVQPVTVNNTMLYETSQGGHIREMGYKWQVNGYVSNDLSLMAKDLFDNNYAIDMAFARSPIPTLFIVNNDGKLICMTYLPEQEVASWYTIDTDGLIESVTVITENNIDTPYVIVNRTINGVTKRYIERIEQPESGFFVDSGLTYTGAATTTISGLNHLEGKTVTILGDDAVMPDRVVSGGSIDLPVAVSKAIVGLKYNATMETLQLSFQDATQGLSRVKNINKVWVRILNSGSFQAGPDMNNLTEIRFREFAPLGSPPTLKSDEFELVIKSDWNQSGKVVVYQDSPLPLEIIHLTVEAAVGG